MTAPNSNTSTLIATTLANQSKKITDNVLTNNTLARHLQKAGNVKVVGGGRKFTHPILYTTNSSFQVRAKLDTIDLPVTDPITESEWEVKILDGSIVLPKLDVAMNAGSKEKLLDYTNTKKMEAESSMGELLGDEVFRSTYAANGFDGIPLIIAEDVTVSTTIGGINQSSNSWWRNYSHDTSVTAFNTSSAGINAIDTSLRMATKGTMKPRLIVTTNVIATLYMLGLSSQARYTSMETGNAKFSELIYGAGIPFVADDNCPSGNLYGIDTENIRLQILAQGNFKNSPFTMAYNQLAERALYWLFANITCGSRRTNFVIDSITG